MEYILAGFRLDEENPLGEIEVIDEVDPSKTVTFLSAPGPYVLYWSLDLCHWMIDPGGHLKWDYEKKIWLSDNINDKI